MAIVLRQNGDTMRTKFAVGADILGECQKLVGGYIEQAGSMTIGSRTFIVLVDEEGLCKEKPANLFFPELVGDILIVELGKEFD